ncbi:MAG: glucosaminidase domain-containing protein [Desulfurobacteriaceae bacterium]
MREYFAFFVIAVLFLLSPLSCMNTDISSNTEKGNSSILRKSEQEEKKEKKRANKPLVINNPTVEDIIPIDCENVLPVIYSHVKSLKELTPKDRKKKFVDVLLPEILIANEEIRKERNFLLSILKKEILSEVEKEKLEYLKDKYRTDDMAELLRRVNTISPSLILAQGAIESGWGTSRFFTEGNNVFGMYAFRPSNKKLKAKEKDVYLKVYDDILDSVRDYIYNLNVGWAYEEFRREREKGSNIDNLIKALTFYSTQRESYVRLLENVIKSNRFTAYDNCTLSK